MPYQAGRPLSAHALEELEQAVAQRTEGDRHLATAMEHYDTGGP